jgi:hypothetical protein
MRFNNRGSFIVIFFVCNICYGQNLRLTSDDERLFFEGLTMKYNKEFPISSSIKEYDVEKLKSFGVSKFNLLSQSERNQFVQFLKKYDQKKISDLKINYNDEATILDSAKVYMQKAPILKYFYTNPNHAVSVESENFLMRVNPILHIEGGNASNYANPIFTNTRGIRLDGYIDKKIYFSTHVLETQQGVLPQTQLFIDEFQSIPQNGLYKIYNSGVIDKLKGYDYLNAQGYVGLPISKSIALEMGHGRHFIGNGMRSLLLSDFSNNYFYLRFNTKVWKLHYQNIFAELTPFSANFIGGDKFLEKKYMASHYLSFKPLKNIEVGLFESVIFSRTNNFDFQYLNPVVFYRTIEHLLGSSDNALLGLNFNYIPTKSIMLYGQVMLDEFNLELIKKDGWWANKQGYQFGMKVANLSLKGVSARLEYNTVRPFTYSHNRPLDNPLSVTSYSHYSQPLAHPLGSNFKEILFAINYRSDKKLQGEVIVASMKKGKDVMDKNYGSNVLKNNATRFQEFGNTTLQGDRNDVMMISTNVSYELFSNYKLFINSQYRKSTSKDVRLNTNQMYIGGGISVNFYSTPQIY